MLDFCAEHGIVPETDLVGADQVNDAFDRVVKGDMRFRYVLDNATMPSVL